MKLWPLAFLVCATSFAAGTNNAPVKFTWTWAPNPLDLGGLSTNDYMTNIAFRLFSSTNINVPLTNWPKVAEWPATNYTDGHWTNSVVMDAAVRFYVMKAWSGKAGGTGESPFSNLDFELADLSAGTLDGIHR